MRRLLFLLPALLVVACLVPGTFAADAAPADAAVETAVPSPKAAEKATATAAAAAAVAVERVVRPPHFLEHLVDSVLRLFDMRSSDNTLAHFGVAGVLLVIALLARRIVTRFLFVLLRKVASRTSTTFDDRLFLALDEPVAALVVVVGIFSSLRVLKLNPNADYYISSGAHVAITLAVFWVLWRTLSTALDYGTDLAKSKGTGVAAFMPWIKKTLLTVFAVLAALLTIQSLGYDVKAILAGLGIGGLAFALAAQDTLANVFGAVVVAVDQPFRIGEFVRIGPHLGGVEDIGLRSTRLRQIDKSLLIIPNKTVAAEAITNLSRFTRRRFEHVIGLPLGTPPDQMNELVEEIRGIVVSQPEVDAPGVMVFFRAITVTSLEIWMVYEVPNPDFQKAMRANQRIVVAIMRAVNARGLSFAFPAQAIHLAGDVAERLAGRNTPPEHPPREIADGERKSEPRTD